MTTDLTNADLTQAKLEATAAVAAIKGDITMRTTSDDKVTCESYGGTHTKGKDGSNQCRL